MREPCMEVRFQAVVEQRHASLKQALCAADRPAHLLPLRHPAIDDVVHDGFGRGCGDPPSASPRSVVVNDVCPILPHIRQQPGGSTLRRLGCRGIEARELRALDAERHDQGAGELEGLFRTSAPKQSANLAGRTRAQRHECRTPSRCHRAGPKRCPERMDLHREVKPIERRLAQRRRDGRDQRAHALGAVAHDFDFGLWRPAALLHGGGHQRSRHGTPRQRTGESSAHAAVTLDTSGDHFELGDFLPGRCRQVGAVDGHTQTLCAATPSPLTGIPAGKELRIFELLTAVQRVAPNGHVARSTKACDLGDDAGGNAVGMRGTVLGT